MSNRCAYTDVRRSLILASLAILAAAGTLFAVEADMEVATPPQPESQTTAHEAGPSPQDSETDRQTEATKRPAFQRKPLPLPETSDSKRPANLMSELLATAVVIVLLGIVTWIVLKYLLPRCRRTTPTRNIRVVETTNLNTRQAVVLVEVGTRRLLLASTRERVSMLADVSDAGTETSGDFAAQLAEAEDADEAGGDG
ncbi:MAG: hypothetical protein GVY16_04775 [Planctomycetes bacterium]|jgi:flagellar biogenesis protein FliO|nr:hypothetical protein [Planctomycetota bacterium]